MRGEKPALGRMTLVQDPVIPIISELAASHPGTISLGQGIVNYPPPPETLDSIAAFLRNPENHKYGHVCGEAKLLAAIKKKLKRDNQIDCGVERSLLVTAGANLAFANAVLAITKPGDEIILLAPFYFNHEMCLTMLSCKPVVVPCDNNYLPNLARIEAAITSKTKAVVSISPNNPTGAVYTETLLRGISELCRSFGIIHICDEAYEYFVREDALHFSPASIQGLEQNIISLFSFSKTYGLAGWRMGYMLYPRQYEESMKKIQDTALICPPRVSQHAALAAIESDPQYRLQNIAQIFSVGGRFKEALDDLGAQVEVSSGQGAFYFMLRVHTSLSSLEFAKRLITEHRVAVLPGETFGMTQGCYLRIAYAALDDKSAAEAIQRLVRGISSLL